MDSETEDTGVFSPPTSKRNAALGESFRKTQTDVPEMERTDVFSPDTSFRSRFVKSLDSLASKENTPPHSETPSFNKQLEDIERKGAKRKNNFNDVLLSQNSEDVSYNKVEDFIDDSESQTIRTKRIKRFQLSPEESVVSKSDDTDILSLGAAISCSQDENKTKRKNRFVVSTNCPESEDSSNYSDVFKTVSKKSQKAERKRIVAPQSLQESDDSLTLAGIFKSNAKNKMRSQLENQDDSCSEEFNLISQNKEKMKQKPRFAQPLSSQESEESGQYSDIFKSVSKDKNKTKRKNAFVIPSSQESEDSRQYSEIFESTLNKPEKAKRNDRFVTRNFHDSEESMHYSDISLSRNVFGHEKKNRFVNPASQEVDDSVDYSNILFTQNDSNVEKKQPFVELTYQESGNSQRYSSILVSQTKVNGEEKCRFIDPISQEIENSSQYSNILVSQTESNVEEKRRFINPTSQEIGDNLHYSDIKISNDENERASRFDVPNTQNSLNNSITLNLSSRSECAASKTNECSTSCENLNDSHQQKCEKTSGTDFTSVRSIFIDTIRSSLNVSAPSSISEMTGKPINLTYDVSTSVFCQQKDASSLVNINLPDVGELENIGSSNSVSVTPTSNMSCELTLVDSNSLEGVNESTTLIESKDESSNPQESCSVVNESESQSGTVQETGSLEETSENESQNVLDSCMMTDKSENKSSSVEEFSLMADESENKSSDVEESSLMADEFEYVSISVQESNSVTDKSGTEKANNRQSLSGIGKSKNENSIFLSENASNSVERDIIESNVTPADSVQSIMTDPIPNSSDVAPSNEEIIEESVYVPFNPSSLMLSVTIAEASLNTHDCNSSTDKSGLNQLELRLSHSAQNNELSSPALCLTEKNIKEHDYAAIQISNVEKNVEFPVTDLVDFPPTEEKSTAYAVEEIPVHSCEETTKESSEVPVAVFHSNEAVAEKTSHVPSIKKIANKSASTQTDAQSIDEIGKETAEPLTDTPCIEKVPEKHVSSTLNDVEIVKDTQSPNACAQPARRSLRSQKSISNELDEPIVSVVSVVDPASSQLFQTIGENEKSSAHVSPTNVVQSRKLTISPNNPVPKLNYSLRSRNSCSSDVQNNHESVPSTSVAALNDIPIDNTGDGLFNLSNSINYIPSRNSSGISSQKESYSSRSRNSTSFCTQNTRTFVSTSSVSVFSKSKIGRPSTAPAEFKVPLKPVPKTAPKKKKNDEFKHLPSRPNFPQFDFYCNKRFYDHLITKMEPKYGIRTNNEAVKLAKYISEVVKKVIAMKTRDHHILVEEMKKVLFRKGIVTTHYNFYIFCMDYMPPWFKRKAIPTNMPVNCPPNVEFDDSLLNNLIE